MKFRGQELGIAVFDDVLSPELCETILESFFQSKRKESGEVFGADGEKRESESKTSIDLDVTELSNELGDQIHHSVTEAFLHYIDQFPGLRGKDFRTPGYKIQMYEKGKGQFIWHSDATSPSTYHRQVALVLYLNDVQEGGETEFYYQSLRIRPRQGYCIFFPPFWTHLHRGNVPVSEDKLVITAFFERTFPDNASQPPVEVT